jgi:hypothetical protein
MISFPSHSFGRDAFWSAQFGDAGLAAQAVQNDPDLLFGRKALAGGPTDVLYEPVASKN